MRICIVYDCLYPWTVGGAERWLRSLAEALAAQNHEVTYLTRLQWPPEDPPRIPGVQVIAISANEPLYDRHGKRTIREPIRFGCGVFWHFLRHRRRYDAVHMAAFPYFSLVAAAGALRGTNTLLVVDWYEVWSKDYWQRYLGKIPGLLGWAVQRICVRVRQRAFVFSDLHGRRLRSEGLHGEPIKLGGLYARDSSSVGVDATAPRTAPLVVFAGRHVPEKGVTAIPPAIAAARKHIPGLRALILGDGPDFALVRSIISRAGLDDIVETPGFVPGDAVHEALAAATCVLLPSRREGYGLIIVEAASVGTPSVVVEGVDNAAVELVEDGINGFVAASDAPEHLAEAIVAAHKGGPDLRESTANWFARRAHHLSLQASLRQVVSIYEDKK